VPSDYNICHPTKDGVPSLRYPNGTYPVFQLEVCLLTCKFEEELIVFVLGFCIYVAGIYTQYLGGVRKELNVTGVRMLDVFYDAYAVITPNEQFVIIDRTPTASVLLELWTLGL